MHLALQRGSILARSCGRNGEIKPFVGLSYATIDREAFVESGAGAVSLRVTDQVSDGLHSRLGALLSYDIADLGPLAVSLQGRLVWSHRLSASSGSVTAGLIDQLGALRSRPRGRTRMPCNPAYGRSV